MPVVRIGRDIGGSEFAHLAADRLERLVEAGGADGLRRRVMVDEFGEAGAVRRRVAGEDQPVDAGGTPRGDLLA